MIVTAIESSDLGGGLTLVAALYKITYSARLNLTFAASLAGRAGGQEESDDEDCTITAITRVDDPVASIDLCSQSEDKDKPSKGKINQVALGAVAPQEKEEDDSGALWESTKVFVDQVRKMQPDKTLMLLDLQVNEKGVSQTYP